MTVISKHRLSNGSLFTVRGFTQRGDIIVDRGWVIDRDFGHLTHGYVVTSHVSQGATVDEVFAGISSQSFPATNERTAYVAMTRGRQKAVVYTDDRKELLKAVSRPDEPLSATELLESTNHNTNVRDRLAKPLALARRLAAVVQRDGGMRTTATRNLHSERDMSHDR